MNGHSRLGGVVSTSRPHGYSVGDKITMTGMYRPWYVRLWRFVTRQKDPVYTVSKTTTYTFEVEP